MHIRNSIEFSSFTCRVRRYYVFDFICCPCLVFIETKCRLAKKLRQTTGITDAIVGLEEAKQSLRAKLEESTHSFGRCPRALVGVMSFITSILCHSIQVSVSFQSADFLWSRAQTFCLLSAQVGRNDSSIHLLVGFLLFWATFRLIYWLLHGWWFLLTLLLLLNIWSSHSFQLNWPVDVRGGIA